MKMPQRCLSQTKTITADQEVLTLLDRRGADQRQLAASIADGRP